MASANGRESPGLKRPALPRTLPLRLLPGRPPAGAAAPGRASPGDAHTPWAWAAMLRRPGRPCVPSLYRRCRFPAERGRPAPLGRIPTSPRRTGKPPGDERVVPGPVRGQRRAAAPLHLPLLDRGQVRHKDFALRDFLDLFNHRLISLFYRAWEKYRLPFRHTSDGSPARRHDADPCTHCPLLPGRPGHPRPARTGWRSTTRPFSITAAISPIAHARPRALQAILRGLFRAANRRAASVRAMAVPEPRGTVPLAGRESRRRHEQPPGRGPGRRRARLGRAEQVPPPRRPAVLAPVLRLMPKGDVLRPLCQMTRMYAGQFDFDVQPVLKAEEVPECRLAERRRPLARLEHLVENGPLRSRFSRCRFRAARRLSHQSSFHKRAPCSRPRLPLLRPA